MADKYLPDQWVNGTSEFLRRLIADGADDEELQRFLDAKKAGDHEAIASIMNRRRTVRQAGRAKGSYDDVLQRVRVAAIRPVVNSLDSAALQRFIQLVLELSSTAVCVAEEEGGATFLSSARTTESLAKIVCEMSMQWSGESERSQVLITYREFANRVCWSAGQLNRALSMRSVFSVEIEGEQRIPAFLADPAFVLKEVRAVCRLLGDLSGSSKLQFFTSPKGSLAGRTPLEALRRHCFSAVKVAAMGFRQR